MDTDRRFSESDLEYHDMLEKPNRREDIRKINTIDDIKWMKAMIPHHSIAILTSNRANLKDPEVKQLAKEIIEAQEKEIAEMKKMIERLENEQ